MDVVETFRCNCLTLPGNGDTSHNELSIEGVTCGVQVDSFHCEEVFKIQDILTINCLRVRTEKGSKIFVSSLLKLMSLNAGYCFTLATPRPLHLWILSNYSPPCLSSSSSINLVGFFFFFLPLQTCCVVPAQGQYTHFYLLFIFFSEVQVFFLQS